MLDGVEMFLVQTQDSLILSCLYNYSGNLVVINILNSVLNPSLYFITSYIVPQHLPSPNHLITAQISQPSHVNSKCYTNPLHHILQTYPRAVSSLSSPTPFAFHGTDRALTSFRNHSRREIGLWTTVVFNVDVVMWLS